MTERLPYGAWPSPITAERVVEGAVTPSGICADGEAVWWAESRPAEGGRIQLVRRDTGGQRHDVLPEGYSARTRVHEYGGGAWTVLAGAAVFANWDDQRLYWLDPSAPSPVAVPLTPQPEVRHGWRYADVGPLGPGWVGCVRESHEPDVVADHGEAVNEIVAVPLDGSAVADPSRVRTLVSGPDFVAAPRCHSSALAWTQWNHPNMPWDATELWTATVECDQTDSPAGLSDARLVAGAGGDESVIQPSWDDAGTLWWSSDRSGWWNLYHDGEVVAPVDGEIGGPAWVFGDSHYAHLPDGRVACAVNADGRMSLGVIDVDQPAEPPQLLDTDLTWIERVAASRDGDVLAIGAAPDAKPAPLRIAVPGRGAALNGGVAVEPLGETAGADLDRRYVSLPEPLEFPSAEGRTAHALWYRPTNPDCEAPEGDQPPLLVFSHGGPTSQSRPMLDLTRQYWTSRGFCVVDVNYGGSTGYGRPYRRLLDHRWGIVDVEDCVAAARHLTQMGAVDAHRLAIRGGSAGGFTTLAALTFTDTFAAGASLYGVADLAALARDTHKFESRYLDGLVGPWPGAAEVYEERSPIHHTDQLSCPMIVLQGLEDEVVPPAQAEAMVEALAAKGIPHAYVTFPGEQHGFRQAANIVRALEAELWFYGQVFDFDPADDMEPPPAQGF